MNFFLALPDTASVRSSYASWIQRNFPKHAVKRLLNPANIKGCLGGGFRSPSAFIKLCDGSTAMRT